MSVRWSGQIRAPINAEYTFKQLRAERANGTMRLWIDDRLVLDSRRNTLATFRSIPVFIEAGRSANFRLEYSFDSQEMRRAQGFPNFPTAVLLWESPTQELQIVPTAVFFQPDGRTPGLRAEYFSDAVFQQKLAEQIDFAVDFVWDRRPVYNEFANEQRRIIQRIIPRVTNDTFLNSLIDDVALDFSRHDLPTILRSASVSERVALLGAISRHKRLLRGFPIQDLADQMQILSLLPEEQASQLLVDWSEKNPLPRTIPARLVSGAGEYVTNNLTIFTQIGHALRKMRPTERDELLEERLALPDGRCNQTLAYSLAMSDGLIRTHILLDRIDAQMRDKSGDVKVTWLIARAYLKENALSHIPRPGRGLPELYEAFAIAESPEYRFWVLQEIVARLITTDQYDEASSLIAGLKAQFPDPIQQAEMDSWLALGQLLKEQYAEVRANSTERTISAFEREMQRRLAVARTLNDTAQERRIQDTLPNSTGQRGRNQ
jgi:hypothetical protein